MTEKRVFSRLLTSPPQSKRPKHTFVYDPTTRTTIRKEKKTRFECVADIWRPFWTLAVLTTIPTASTFIQHCALLMRDNRCPRSLGRCSNENLDKTVERKGGKEDQLWWPGNFLVFFSSWLLIAVHSRPLPFHNLFFLTIFRLQITQRPFSLSPTQPRSFLQSFLLLLIVALGSSL